MLSFGRLSFGLHGPYRRRVVYAVGAATLSVGVSATPSLHHAGSGAASIQVAVSGVATRKQLATVQSGVSLNTYPNAHVKHFSGAQSGIGLSAAGHTYRYLSASGDAGLNVDLYGVPASVLVTGSTGISLQASGVGTRKQYGKTSTAVVDVTVSAGALMKRGAKAVSGGFAAIARGSGMRKRAGDSFWYLESDGSSGIDLSLGVDNSLTILKGLGGRITGVNLSLSGWAYLKRHGEAVVPLEVSVSAVGNQRLNAVAECQSGYSASGSSVLKKIASGSCHGLFSMSGRAVQQHAIFSSCAVGCDVSGVPFMVHAGRAGSDFLFGLSARAYVLRPASGRADLVMGVYGKGSMMRYATGDASLTMLMSGFAYENIGVDAPPCRTAVMEEEIREMSVPEEDRLMEVVC